MQRVHRAIAGDGLNRCTERLPEHLPTKDQAPAQVLALAAKEVVLEFFEGEEIDQFVQDCAHGVAIPREWANHGGEACRCQYARGGHGTNG